MLAHGDKVEVLAANPKILPYQPQQHLPGLSALTQDLSHHVLPLEAQISPRLAPTLEQYSPGRLGRQTASLRN